jgi:hypothetical protein
MFSQKISKEKYVTVQNDRRKGESAHGRKKYDFLPPAAHSA